MKKNKYAKDLNLEELSQDEMQQIDAGILPVIIGGVIFIGIMLWPEKAH